MAFIHRVQDEKKTYGVPDPSEWNKLLFFDNYVGAATGAYLHKLISIEGLERVVKAAKEEFKKISWVSEQQRLKALKHFEVDCEKADSLLELSKFMDY